MFSSVTQEVEPPLCNDAGPSQDSLVNSRPLRLTLTRHFSDILLMLVGAKRYVMLHPQKCIVPINPSAFLEESYHGHSN